MTRPLDRPGPRWFTIPAHRPFARDLADGLLAQFEGEDPQALSRSVVLLPNRRGARALADAFLEASGGQAILLPQIRALGDLDEGEPPFEPGDLSLDLPPAITPLRRRFELAGLAAKLAPRLNRSLDTVGALEMADALAGLLDSLQIEEVDALGRIDALAQGDLAEHWRRSSEVLRAVLAAWPERLAAMGLIDVAERRVRLLRALAASWKVRPPAEALIAAGSTGSAPATAALLTVVADCPQGAVVLPGLDEGLAEDAWALVDDQHPQGGLRRLLALAGVERSAVALWRPLPRDTGRWRRRLINEALRPAEATHDWLAQIDRLRAEAGGDDPDPVASGFKGLSLITARHEEEAAEVCALLLREALETPAKTAALVTPDLDLARRVSARLTRWGVTADSSAGRPLPGFPAAALAQLVAELVAEPSDPVRLLAMAKHPLTRLGLAGETLERGRIALERYALRGPRPRDFQEIRHRIATAAQPREDGAEAPSARRRALADAGLVADRLEAALALAAAPFAEGPAEPALAASALGAAMEALAGDGAGDTGGLWAGRAGEALGGLIAGLIGEGEALIATDPQGFAELLAVLLAGETVRVVGAAHPRLKILGAIEARLIQADRLVLAGLEEGTWPRGAPVDPFLSRPMRASLGLPSPERRIGLTSHDFAQAACAPEVILVNAERRGGSPAVESRWLWRLRTLARGAKVEIPRRDDVLAWARGLDAPDLVTPAIRPAPTPPLEARPVGLSVTRIERWLRDPYEIYARYILGLKTLDAADLPVGPRERGTAVHAALERFARDHSGALPDEAESLIRLYLQEALRAAGLPEPRMARETALARNVAPWLVELERKRRVGARLVVEETGTLELRVNDQVFTLTAKADRLEVRGGVVDIIDFKTGAAPSAKQVREHLAPQLTLTAAILMANGFPGLTGATPGELVYVQVKGGRTVGDEAIRAAAPESGDLAGAALDNLIRRIGAFQNPATAYLSRAMPQYMGDAGDYDHLARVREWSVAADDDGGGA